VGSSLLDNNRLSHAFLSEGGPMLDLNSSLAAGSGWELEEARAINDLDQITGWGQHQGRREALLWSDGTVRALRFLPGGNVSFGLGLNHSNQVVGAAGLGEGLHAFVAQGVLMWDLNQFLPANSGWELLEARGINDSGQIVGWGIIRGEEHAFLLEPVSVGQP